MFQNCLFFMFSFVVDVVHTFYLQSIYFLSSKCILASGLHNKLSSYFTLLLHFARLATFHDFLNLTPESITETTVNETLNFTNLPQPINQLVYWFLSLTFLLSLPILQHVFLLQFMCRAGVN